MATLNDTGLNLSQDLLYISFHSFFLCFLVVAICIGAYRFAGIHKQLGAKGCIHLLQMS
jgi:hypothetical protein